MHVDVELLLECLTWKLMSEHSEQVRCQVEQAKRNSISKSNHVLFCLPYKHNSPLLTRKTTLMNENKSIQNPWIEIEKSVGEKNVLKQYKTNNGHNFQHTKFSVTDFGLTNRRNLSVTQPRSACGKSFSSRFSSSATRNAIIKAT